MEQNDPSLRIITWNINGIRSLPQFTEWLDQSPADIVCVQETKVTRDMLTENVALVPGWSSYFGFSKGKGGYSGVATYCRSTSTPVGAEEGITGILSPTSDKLLTSDVGAAEDLKLEFSQEELKNLDNEGRCVITKHLVQSVKEGVEQYLFVINVYCPRADPDREDRKRFKLQFYKALDIRANALRSRGHHVIIVGDVNTSHKEIDHCDPYDEFWDHPGRRFLNHFLHTSTQPEQPASNGDTDIEVNSDAWECEVARVEEKQFIDSFRIFHPDRKLAFTCWNTKMNCRSTNYGTRIDYIFISRSLEAIILECDIQPDVMGSDHCPVKAAFKLRLKSSLKLPAWASKNFPEFSGKQLSIKEMLSKPKPTTSSINNNYRERSPLKTCQSSINNQNASKGQSTTVNSKKAPSKTNAGSAKITNFFAAKSDAKKIKLDPTPEGPAKAFDSDSTLGDHVNIKRNVESKAAWSALFKPPPPAPLCSKHKEESVKRKVTKKGPNNGREFYCCRRGEGRADDPAARCDFFQWAK